MTLQPDYKKFPVVFLWERQYYRPIEPCIHCGNLTSLYFQGRPVCIDCDRQRDADDNTAPLKKPPQKAEENEKRDVADPGHAFG